MLCFHERHVLLLVTTHHHVVLRKARPSVLSITTSSCCVFTKGARPPCYQSQLIIMLFSRKARPPCYQSQLIIMLCFHERHVLRAIITTHHHVVFADTSLRALSQHHHLFTRCISHNSSLMVSQGITSMSKGARPPCISHNLIIVCFTRGRPSSINHNSSCCVSRRHVLRAINHNSSSCCVFTKGTSSVLSITTHHHVVFSRKGHVPPCYQSQLIIMLCFHEARPSVLSITTHHHCVFTKGTSLRAINHNSSSCVFTEARPSVLSITTHHMLVHEGTPLRAINHNSSSRCVFTKGIVPVLSITTHHHVVPRKGHVPPCYQSQLIIMLCFHERHVLRAINHNSSSLCFHEEARPSVLSITTHHHVVFSRASTSSVLSITTHHHVVFHERHVLRAINHNSSCCVFTKGTSVLSITTHHHVVVSRRHVLVLSITTHHHVVFSRKGHVPPCYHHNSSSCCVFTKARPSVLSSQLIIMLCFHERHVPPCIINSSSCCVFKRHVLRAINHNSSYVVFSRKARPSVLSVTTHHHKPCAFRKARPPQSQLIIMFVFTNEAQPRTKTSQKTPHNFLVAVWAWIRAKPTT
jgi:hypothetical protein